MSAKMTSQLNTYRIADFLEWNDKKQLILNPEFQRNEVWSDSAKVYLIDSILRQFSLPKFYIRTKIDLESRRTIREVVDGQQRLSAILSFASDKLQLTSRAGDLKGYKYSTLPSDLQEKFLNYNLSVEQLVSADDSDVLEVFARLNSYGSTLKPAEMRHAEYQGPFKWSVRELSKKNGNLFAKYKIIGTRDRLRMADDALIAELYGIILEGVKDGGEKNLTNLYKKYDVEFSEQTDVEKKVQACIDEIVNRYSDFLPTPLGRRPQFIMLFAAVAHSAYGLPQGGLIDLPVQGKLLSKEEGSEGLDRLVRALSSADENVLSSDLQAFRDASRSTTHRIASRRVRFSQIYRAIIGE